MKKNILVICFSLISLLSNAQEVTTYYFIRHAEKLRVDKSERNPNLNSKDLKEQKHGKRFSLTFLLMPYILQITLELD